MAIEQNDAPELAEIIFKYRPMTGDQGQTLIDYTYTPTAPEMVGAVVAVVRHIDFITRQNPNIGRGDFVRSVSSVLNLLVKEKYPSDGKSEPWKG